MGFPAVLEAYESVRYCYFGYPHGRHYGYSGMFNGQHCEPNAFSSKFLAADSRGDEYGKCNHYAFIINNSCNRSNKIRVENGANYPDFPEHPVR